MEEHPRRPNLEQTTQIRREPLRPGQPPVDGPRDGSASTKRWLVVACIVAAIAIALAIGLGVSRSGWKDRALTAESELSDTRVTAAEDDADARDDAETDPPAPTTDDTDTVDEEATSETEESVTVTDCDDFGLEGESEVDGGGYYDISTRNMSCDDAKELIVGRTFDGGDKVAEAEGWTCTQLAQVDETTEWRCEQDEMAFRYSFGL